MINFLNGANGYIKFGINHLKFFISF